MSRLPPLKSMILPLVVLLAAMAVSGISFVILPDWALATLGPISLLAGAILGVIFQYFLPDDLKEVIHFRVNRLKKEFDPPSVTITLATNYALDDPQDQEEFVDEVKTQLGVNPTGMDLFTTEEKTTMGSVKKKINLDSAPTSTGTAGRGPVGQQMISASEVTNIRVKLEIETNYNDLRDALLLIYDKQTNLRDIFATFGIESDGYTITCEMADSLVIDELMTKLNVSKIKARTTNGVEVRISDKEIRIRNIGGEELPSMFNWVEDIVTYYG